MLPLFSLLAQGRFLRGRDQIMRSLFVLYYVIFSLDMHRDTIPESSVAQFQSIFRRLYRIFAHVYFHHRGLFMTLEV